MDPVMTGPLARRLGASVSRSSGASNSGAEAAAAADLAEPAALAAPAVLAAPPAPGLLQADRLRAKARTSTETGAGVE